ncbi:cupin domain-containing protein [Dactylosporangium sp. CS-033363]|uniref:cupin domain-containing protein n=1 Tax=Dactylosporangium sp. CS-033363 TaxID=3239935 RepID=UPI003D8F2E51
MTDESNREPQVLRYRDLERRTWGDETTGRLCDWFYADDATMNLNIVGMPPNGSAISSPANPTVFGADELFYVLEGRMVQSNPVTGEVFVVNPGEAIFFRKDTWHYQWNHSNVQLRMLEFFQPAPKSGTGGAYARAQPPLAGPPKQGQDELIGNWPMARDTPREQTTWMIREADILWRMEGETRGREILVGILASTEHLTAGKMSFLGGQRSDVYTHSADKVIFVESGNLHVELTGTKKWVELDAWDGVRIPAGTPHSFYNMSHEAATCLFSVAGDYLPGPSA